MALFQRVKSPLVENIADGAIAAGSGPRSAGDLLRQQRQSRGLDIAAAAAALRIKPAYIEALEAGRPDALPGPAYAIGFMRAYAEYLGLDSREVLRRFRQEGSGLAPKSELSFPMPLRERSMPGGRMLPLALVLAICGYGTWYYVSTGDHWRPERVAEVPAELRAAIPQPPRSDPPNPHSAQASAAPKALAPAAGSSPPGDAANSGSASAGPPVVAAIPIAAPQETTGSTGAAPGSIPQSSLGPAEMPARIVIRATADSWVEIRGAGRSVLVARLLKAGESYRVPDQPGLSMRTGNAGGLEITVDGNRAPPIGHMGMVRRNVALDPQALIAGTAVRG